MTPRGLASVYHLRTLVLGVDYDRLYYGRRLLLSPSSRATVLTAMHQPNTLHYLGVTRSLGLCRSLRHFYTYTIYTFSRNA